MIWKSSFLSLLLVLLFIARISAADEGFRLMFRPLSVETYSDMPADLAKTYPNHVMVLVIFKPVSHPAAKDGSNLKDGEGSWLDRGMKPGEPDRIRFLIADGDMLPHTLKVSEGPFIFKVRNSGKGYFETVPLASPELQIVWAPTSNTKWVARQTNPVQRSFFGWLHRFSLLGTWKS